MKKPDKHSLQRLCPVKLPMTGQLSNHFIEGMRKIYELEPFIKMGSILTDPLNKGVKGYKRAS